MKENYNFEDVVELLAISAYVAWSNVLSGSNSAAQHNYFERMRHPTVGELVLEITTHRRVKAIDRIGRLISVTREPYDYPDWNVSEDGPIPTREIWTIKTLDGREFRWENCDFIVIPEDPFNHPGKLACDYA